MTEEAAGVLLADRRDSQMRGFEEGIQCPGLHLPQRDCFIFEKASSIGLWSGVPRRQVVGHVAPRRAGTYYPPKPVQDLAQ